MESLLRSVMKISIFYIIITFYPILNHNFLSSYFGNTNIIAGSFSESK